MPICHMLGSAFALRLVHTLNHLQYTMCQTMCWLIQQTQLWRRCGPFPQEGHCLGRRKKCIPQNKCNGRSGCISNDPKIERGMELAFEGSTDNCKCREVECSLIIHCSQSLTCHRNRNKQTGTTECTLDIC